MGFPILPTQWDRPCSEWPELLEFPPFLTGGIKRAEVRLCGFRLGELGKLCPELGHRMLEREFRALTMGNRP